MIQRRRSGSKWRKRYRWIVRITAAAEAFGLGREESKAELLLSDPTCTVRGDDDNVDRAAHRLFTGLKSHRIDGCTHGVICKINGVLKRKKLERHAEAWNRGVCSARID